MHYCPLDELLARVGTDPKKGLSTVQQVHGHRAARNVMSPPYTQHWLLRLAKVSLGGFNWLLLIIATLDVLAWEPLGENPGPPSPHQLVHRHRAVHLHLRQHLLQCISAEKDVQSRGLIQEHGPGGGNGAQRRELGANQCHGAAGR